MDDGRVKSLGVVVGRDGRDGADGRDGVDGTNGKDGANGIDGKDGRDGLQLDGFDVTFMPDGRTAEFTWSSGDTAFTVEKVFPVPIYRGLFKDGDTYSQGDFVTFGGSVWHCDAEQTAQRPGGEDWSLAVKRGQNGRNGVDAAPPPPSNIPFE